MRRIGSYVLFLFFLAFVSAQLSTLLFRQGVSWELSGTRPEDDDFRRMSLSDEMLSELITAHSCSGMRLGELLTILRSDAKDSACPPGKNAAEDFVKWKRSMTSFNREGYEKLSAVYSAIWDDVRCFPVAAEGIVYENSWMFERNYGGKRGHEGTDLMPPENLRGHYPVVSMTDGVVEQVGWLPLGGYRIGIRSPSGGYFYYAHLDSYSRTFWVGETISAGTILGRMGDSGYGPEGTRGKFDVHLHLGIYIRTEDTRELSVNPYWVLRYVASFAGIC